MPATVAAVQRAALRRAVVDEGVAADHFVLAAALEGARRAENERAPLDRDLGGLMTATLASVLATVETDAPSPTSAGVRPDPDRHRLLLDGALLAHRRLDVSLSDAAATAGVSERELRRHRDRD